MCRKGFAGNVFFLLEEHQGKCKKLGVRPLDFARERLWALGIGKFLIQRIQPIQQKNPAVAGFFGWKMGLEPTTSGTTIQRSNRLSYIHHWECKYAINFHVSQKENGWNFKYQRKNFIFGKILSNDPLFYSVIPVWFESQKDIHQCWQPAIISADQVHHISDHQHPVYQKSSYPLRYRSFWGVYVHCGICQFFLGHRCHPVVSFTGT